MRGARSRGAGTGGENAASKVPVARSKVIDVGIPAIAVGYGRTSASKASTLRRLSGPAGRVRSAMIDSL
jgi:hypothetical protein